MAIFPQGLTNIDQRCDIGERRVLHQLKRCLDDDCLVWHDVPIGPRARQPDFIVLAPRRGVLLLEVKNWKLSSLGAATRDAVELSTERGRVTRPHPLRQARDYALELADLMQRDAALVHRDGPFAGKLVMPYGWGVVLSNIRRAEVRGTDFDEIFAPARTMLRDDLDDAVDAGVFQQRLWSMFVQHHACTLTLPQRDRIRWHLFPELRAPQQRSLLGEPGDAAATLELPDLLQVMDLQQEQIARTLGEGHRVIHGAAGSGKTMILVYRTQQLAAAATVERPILIVCYNRALAGRIAALLRERGIDERAVVRTFHAWCEDLVRTYRLDVPTERGAAHYWDSLAATVSRAVETGFVPGGQYTALLIDEAHDFEDAWLQIAARMVRPDTRSLLVLYDDVQSIYQRRRKRFNFASVGIDAVGRTSILRLNYRNTAEVLALALHCAQTLLRGGADAPDAIERVQPTTAGRRGPMPVLMLAGSEAEEASLVAERIRHAHARGRPFGDMAVLARTRSHLAAFEPVFRRMGLPCRSMAVDRFGPHDWSEPSVKLLTLHSSKGLEFPLVFVAGLHSLPYKDEPMDEEVRLLYVGMTRATHELVLSAHGSSPMVRKVKASIEAVGAQFGAEA